MNKQNEEKLLEIKLHDEATELESISLFSLQDNSINIYNKNTENIDSNKDEDQIVIIEEPNAKREPSSPNMIPNNFWRKPSKEFSPPEQKEQNLTPDIRNSISLKMSYSSISIPVNIIQNFNCNKNIYDFECQNDSSEINDLINYPQKRLNNEIEFAKINRENTPNFKNFKNFNQLNPKGSLQNEDKSNTSNKSNKSKDWEIFLKDSMKRKALKETNKPQKSGIMEKKLDISNRSPPLTARINYDLDSDNLNNVNTKSSVKSVLSSEINKSERENEILKFNCSSSFHTNLNKDRINHESINLKNLKNLKNEIGRRNILIGFQNGISGRNKERTINHKKVIEVNFIKNSPKIIKKEYRIKNDLISKFDENFNRVLGKLEFHSLFLTFSQTKQLFTELALLDDKIKSEQQLLDMWKLISTKNICPIQNIKNFLSVVINMKQEISSKTKTTYTYCSNGTKYGRIIESGEFIANKEESERLKEHFKLFKTNHIKSRKKSNSIYAQNDISQIKILCARNHDFNLKMNAESLSNNKKKHPFQNNSSFNIRKKSMLINESGTINSNNNKISPSKSKIKENTISNYSSHNSPLISIGKNTFHLPSEKKILIKQRTNQSTKNQITKKFCHQEEFNMNKQNLNKKSDSKEIVPNLKEKYDDKISNTLSKKCDHFDFSNKILAQDGLNRVTKNIVNELLFYIDVNIGNDVYDRIFVYDNDSTEAIASDFIAKHKLDNEEKTKLINLINSQISSLLDSIKEESKE